jgi:hypothetical protein
MKKILFFLAIALPWLGMAQIKLSKKAEISVITCGPWQAEVYTAFGHSAIRVKDDSLGIDLAYNYGVFDFHQPNFYLNFTKGYLYYQLGVRKYQDFHYEYEYFNRYVHEQKLDLTDSQKQKVFDYLLWNSKPENKSYVYDYFYNNCATKIRDVFADVLKGEVVFDGSYVKTKYTIRQLTDLYLQQQPWGDLGIDICLGLPMDKPASPYEYMFLPDYIESGFDHATINGNPIVKGKITSNGGKVEVLPRRLFHPWNVFGFFFLITATISWYDWKRKKISKWFDVILFTVLGLLGWLLLLLWTATDHHAAAKNFNLLWALPSHLLIFGILAGHPKPFLKKYFAGVSAVCGLLLLSWAFLPQQLNLFLIPFVGVILLRSFILASLLTKSIKKEALVAV